MSGIAGPTSQFLNGTHEFSELVLARIALLMDQSRSVLSLRSAKARELSREKCTRTHWTFPFKLVRTSSFRPARTNGKQPQTHKNRILPPHWIILVNVLNSESLSLASLFVLGKLQCTTNKHKSLSVLPRLVDWVVFPRHCLCKSVRKSIN